MSTSDDLDRNSTRPSESVALEKLLNLQRIQSLSNLFLIILYFPIGLCLLIIRFFIFLYILAISAILPHSSFRRSLFFILGISVNVDEEYFKNLKAKTFISNHISDLDPLILNLLFPCAYISASESPCYVNWLCRMAKVDEDENVIESTMKNIPVVCFPEQAQSNGQHGLFKFSPVHFHSVSLAHLIFLEANRPFFNVSVSTLGANWFTDLFWVLFLPITIFKVRHLGIVKKQENETYEEFAKRTQLEMAKKTNLHPTEFGTHDKKEFQKRLILDSKIKKSTKKNTKNVKSSNIDQLARKVKEILPQVPLSVLRDDIGITNNIDNTIERILNGTVKYVPETTKSSTNLEPSLSLSNLDDNSKNMTSSKSFGKTPSERVASFQERKEQMFRMARIRYLQKYGPIKTN